MDFSKEKRQIVECCHMLYQKGYTQASGGNVSCRIGDTGYFAIKKTAINMGFMTEEDVIIVDENGNVIEGNGMPSKEINFHLGVMKLRPNVNAVVHCHPNFAISFANNELCLPHTTVTSRKVVGYTPWVEVAPAGSKELSDFVVDGFRNNPNSNAILMKQHGVCVGGTSVMHAYNITDLLEQTAKQAYFECQIAKDKEFYKNIEK